MLAEFAARVHRATAEALGFWLAPAPTAAANALAMGHARVLAHHHAAGPGEDPIVTVPWHGAALPGLMATRSAKNAIVDQSAAQSAMSEFG
jgi:hypothetical protein